MQLSTLQTGLPTLLTALLGVSCQWATQPRRYVAGPSAVVDFLGSGGIGVDEVVWEDVDVSGQPTEVAEDVVGVKPTQLGLREATLQVTMWSNNQTLQSSARAALERLRSRLRLPSTVDGLKELGIALVTVEPIQQIDITQDGRVMSQASIDLRIAYGVSETEDAIPFIESARAYSEELRDAAGEPLPEALQVDQTIAES